MRKAPLYSRSPTRPAASPPPDAAVHAGQAPEAAAATKKAADPAAHAEEAPPRRSRLRRFLTRHERQLWATGIAMLLMGALALNAANVPKTPALTMKQIDAAMRKSIAEKPLDSAAAKAYDTVIPSVVRVVGLMTEGDDGSDIKDDAKNGRAPVERGIGTGVVIIDNGTILTNLHVVSGAKRIRVSFMDGTESDAQLLSVQPENDLAVLRARSIPDDLQAATMRSTGDLAPGDRVIAVGFPFGIGPSVSEGVVSGLKREFRSPEGQQTLSNLIQFDAAANPGNSGGPLVTMDGEVVGIVTAILNPSRQRVFIGIGFAVPIENAAAAAGMPPF
ncbi:MAG TPA: trypsin-like peptidase domain-containing protein [Burkholderiaceae bacterium]